MPKQFIELKGKPVILHTLDAFFRYSNQITVILVLPEGDLERWQQIRRTYHYERDIVVQSGGETRFQSVRRGLERISGEGLVAIHDGVRPLVSEDIIAASFRLAAVHNAAVASVRLKESIRVTDQDQTRAVDRSKYRLIQTPQTFRVSMIKKAYQLKEDESLTDDASVAEKSGMTISLFEGSYRNLKITTEEDVAIAEALLSNPSDAASSIH